GGAEGEPLSHSRGLADVLISNNGVAHLRVAGRLRCCIYVVAGALRVGGTQLFLGDLGWIEPMAEAETELRLTAWAHGARALVFAAEPTLEKVVHRELLVAASRHELSDKIRPSKAGAFPSLGDLT